MRAHTTSCVERVNDMCEDLKPPLRVHARRRIQLDHCGASGEHDSQIAAVAFWVAHMFTRHRRIGRLLSHRS